MKSRSIKLKILLSLAVTGLFFFTLAVGETFAATYFWIGANGANVNVSSNWTATNPTSCTGTAASVPGPSDIAIFDADCDNNANIPGDWSVNTLTMSSGYAGTISGGAGSRIITTSLTQDAGTLNIETLEQNRYAGTVAFNAGSRTIINYISSNTLALNGNPTFLGAATGQSVTFTNMYFSGIQGTFRLYNPGTINTTNLIFIDGTNFAWNDSVNLNVTGDITVPSSKVNNPINNIITLSGSGNQTITNNSTSTLAQTFIVDKSGGSVTITGSEFKVGTLTYTRGTVTADTLTATTFTQAAGTLTATNFTVNSMTQTAGALNVTTLTHARTGTQTLAFNGGTRSISTLIITGTAYGTTITAGTGVSLSFGEIIITTTGGTFSTSGAGSVTTVNLTFSNTNTYLLAGTLNVTGDITTSALMITDSAGIINLTGTGAQTINSSSTASLALTLVINKASGTATVVGPEFKVGTFTLTQGTFTATKLTASTFTQTAGVLTLNTLMYTGSNSSLTFTNGTSTINTLSFSGAANNATLSVAAARSLTVVNTILSTGFYIYMPAAGTGAFTTHNLTYNAGTLTQLYSGVINVTGDITTAASVVLVSSITINLVGTSTQTIYSNSTSVFVPVFNVNKTGGTVTVVGPEFKVGAFTLTQGDFIAPKLTATNLTQTAGTSTITTLEFLKSTGCTFNFNGGNEIIDTLLVSGSGTNCAINVPLGQTLSVTNFNISGTNGTPGSVNLPTAITGTFNTTNLTYLSTTNTYIYSGVINVTGDITTVSTVVTDPSHTINLTGTSNQTITNGSSARLATTLVVNKGSGTVTVVGSNISVTNFTQTQGNFTATKLTVSNLTQTSGDLAVTTIEQLRAGNQLTFNGGTRNGGTNIPNVISTGSSGTTWTIALNQTVSIDNLSISGVGGYIQRSGSGTLNIVDVTFLAGSTAYLRSGTFNVSGNFTTVSTLPDSTSSFTLVLNGSGDQVITVGTSSSRIAVTLTINKPSGSVTTSGQNLYVGTLNLTAGNFTSNTIKVASALTQTTGDFTVDTLEVGTTATYTFNGGTRTINTLKVVNSSAGTMSITMAVGQSLYIGEVQMNNTTGAISLGGSGQGTVTVGNLIRAANATGNVSGVYTVLGDITNLNASSVMTATGGSTVTLSTSTDQTLTGNITFVNLTKQVTAPSTLYFSAGNTVTITTTLRLSGASSAARLSLRSTTPTVQWRINPSATPAASYRFLSNIDVKDSNNINATSMNAGSISGYVNSGNNTNWGDTGITVTADPNRTWKGQTSNLWSVASNWWEGLVPGATENAIFNAAGGTYPALYDASVAAAPLTIQILNGYNSTTTLGKDVSITGALTQSGGTYVGGGYNLTVGGAASISGGTFNVGSGQANFAGAFSQTGGTFNGNSGTTTVGGNFSRTTGTFNGGTGLVSLTGGNQTISGTTTFANLSKIVSSAATLTFPASKTTTITGTTTLKGVSGNLLSLRSSSAGTQWGFDPQGGRVFEYLDVKDSNNVNATEISAANHVGLTDVNGYGSNTNWVFTIPILTISATGTQAASTSLPVTGKYMGGAFVATSSVPANITSITLTQSPSLSPAYISSVRLYYASSTAGVCANTITGANSFGSPATNWSATSSITIAGTLPVSIDPVCIYPVFNLIGSFTPDLLLRSVDLRIVNPSTDIVAAGVDIGPVTPVDITGITLVEGYSSALPTITLQVASSTMSTGATTTLTWATGNIVSGCNATGDWSGAKNIAGGTEATEIMSQHRLYSYTLACHNTLGTTTVAVYVNAINPNAPVLSFAAASTSVASGTATVLTWSNQDGLRTPTSCIGTGSSGWPGSKAFDGTYDTGPITSYKSYTLACGNSYGTTTRSVGVGISGGVPAVPHCNNDVMDYDETAVDYGGSCGSGVSVSSPSASYGDRVRAKMPNDDEVVFYFYNDGRHNALYQRTGPINSPVIRKLTAENLNVVSGSFDEISCLNGSNECGGLRVQMVLQKLSSAGSVQSFQVEKTFKTTVKAKKNQ